MKKNAFTIIELLVAITIIGVLSTFGATTYFNISSKSRDSLRKSDLSKLAAALELYQQQHNLTYIDGTPGSEGDCSSADTSAFYTGITSYLSDNKVPKDPKTGANYCYVSVNNGQSFRLFAKLENCTDPQNPLCSQSDYNYSIVSDNITLAYASGGAIPTPAPAPTAVPTPIPSVIVNNCANRGGVCTTSYGISANGRICNQIGSLGSGLPDCTGSYTQCSSGCNAAPTPTPTPTPAPTPIPTIPIYRYWSQSDTDHFYTRSSASVTNYVYEGIAFYAYNPPCPTGTIPIYRSYSGAIRDHLYSTSASEGPNAGYSDEGVEFCALASSGTGRTPVVRMYSPSLTDHFYSTDSNPPSGYNIEGSSSGYFFVPTPATQPILCPGSYIENGCFENSPDGLYTWFCTGAGPGTCTIENTPSGFSLSSINSVKVTNNYGWWGYQTGKSVPQIQRGATYCLQAWVKKQSAGDSVSIAFQEGNPPWREFDVFTGTTTWGLAKSTITMPGDWNLPIGFFLRVWNTGGAAWFDNVSVTNGSCP